MGFSSVIRDTQYVQDPYYEHRLHESLTSNRKYNVIMLIILALVSFGFSLGLFEWSIVSLSLAFISMVKAYYFVQIKRYRKTLQHQEV